MNRSERVLDGSLGRATRLVRDGAMVYRAVRNGLLAFGVTASVFLPLAGPTNQQPPATTTVSVLPNVPVVVHNEITPGSTIPPPEVTTPKIEVAVLTSPIQGAPPISRAWHRTTFSRTGDEFWALPDAEFKLKFTRGENFEDCINQEPPAERPVGDGPHAVCQGSFELATDLKNNFGLRTVPGRGITLVDDPAPDECRLHEAPEVLTPTAVCKIKRKKGRDLCIWLRRSEHPESKRYTRQVGGKDTEVVDWLPETVALDVRWKEVEDDGRCLALLPD